MSIKNVISAEVYLETLLNESSFSKAVFLIEEEYQKADDKKTFLYALIMKLVFTHIKASELEAECAQLKRQYLSTAETVQ